MAKKNAPQKNSPQPAQGHVTKTAAGVLAAACLLIGLFIGLNISMLMGPGSSKPTISVADVTPVDTTGGSPAAFDFEALRKEAEGDPTHSHGWIALGHAYFDSNQPGLAIKAYEKALAIEPDNADVWTDLGVMYRRSGDPGQAVKSFDRAMLADPSHQTARFNKGIVLLHDLNDRAGAIASWEMLLKINPEARTPGGKPLRELISEVRAGG